jgi:anionic cell wall polymer biosynthesis LytR-Cps2A-Psr (LCP) family protein
MLKQSYSRIKKISAILLAILFLISLTTVAASAPSVSFTNYGIDDISDHSNTTSIPNYDYRSTDSDSHSNTGLNTFGPDPNKDTYVGVSYPNY